MPKTIHTRAQTDDSHLSHQIHPVVKQIYAARGIKSDQELDNSAQSLLDFRLLKDIDIAAIF